MIKHWLKLLLREDYRRNNRLKQDLFRVKKLPRYTQRLVSILDKQFYIVDSISFTYQYQEIFEKKIYQFVSSKSSTPKIIDCGANIGVSVLYFKQAYPNAQIIAFEPDRNIFEILKRNIELHHLADVKLFNKALWNVNGEIDFYTEGSDAGGVHYRGSKQRKSYKVDTVLLSKFLQNKIDLLKIDIEGAEFEVLEECNTLLKNVENIFIEYHSIVGKAQYLHKILQVLTDNNFRYYISQTGMESFQPFVKRETWENMDNQLNIFGYRSF